MSVQLGPIRSSEISSGTSLGSVNSPGSDTCTRLVHSGLATWFSGKTFTLPQSGAMFVLLVLHTHHLELDLKCDGFQRFNKHVRVVDYR